MTRTRDDDSEPTGRDLDALTAEEPTDEELEGVEVEDDEETVEEAAEEEETAEDPGETEDDAESDLEAAFAEEADPEAVAEEPAPPKEPAKPSKTEPFKPIRLRVDGQEIELPEAREGIYNGERVRILKDADWNLLHSRLRDPAALRRQQQEHKAALAAADPARNPITIRARVWLEELSTFLKPLMEKGDTTALEEWIANAQVNSLRMQLRADEEIRTAQSQVQQQRQNEEEVERSAAAYIPILERGLDDALTGILAQPEYKGLGLSAKQLRENFWDLRAELFFEADEADAEMYGVPVGQLMVNNQRLRQLIEPARQAAAALSRKNPDARRRRLNAGAAGAKPPAKTAAPVVRRAGSRADAAETPQKKKYATREEWEADLYKEARR